MHFYTISPTNDLDQFDFVLFRLARMFVEVHESFADAAIAQGIRMDHAELERTDEPCSSLKIRLPAEEV